MREMVERIKRKRNAENIGICFEPLEPRLLLSGSWGAGKTELPNPEYRLPPTLMCKVVFLKE